MDRPTSTSPTLRQRIGQLPDQPGVYLFTDAQGELLYVGKAASLRKRVASYFRLPAPPVGGAQAGPTATLPPRIAKMARAIADVEIRQTTSEA